MSNDISNNADLLDLIILGAVFWALPTAALGLSFLLVAHAEH